MQKWLGVLREMCEAKFPACAYLEEDFPVLGHMDFSEMELPGQFQQLAFSPEACVFIVRLGTRVSLVRRHGVSMRRIDLVCSDGETRSFSIATTQTHNLNSTDQRMMGVYRYVFLRCCVFVAAFFRGMDWLDLFQGIFLFCWELLPLL